MRQFFLGFIRAILNFVLNGIRIPFFFQIPVNLSNYPLLFSKKDLENTKNVNKITKKKSKPNKIITILSIVFVFLFIIIIDYFENLCKKKQHLLLLKEVYKFLKKNKSYPIVPLFSLWLNGNEIICDAGLGCENESIDQGRSYYNNNINISNCFFSRSLSYSGNGGVIFVTASSCLMNINYSMFYNCVCSIDGGAIYFDSSNSSLRMICANSCSASQFHVAYIIASQMNQVEYLSISKCSHTTSGYYSILLYKGNQRVDNTNSSMNNAIQASGILITSPSSFTSSHCTFSNNKVSHSICIYFYSSSETKSMLYANIVHNNSPSGFGVVYVYGAFPKMMM